MEKGTEWHMIPVMDVWGIDLWADENLAVRAKAVLTVMRQALGISAGQAAQTEKLIDATVKARRARQERDFAEIGAPFVNTDAPTAEQIGYRTFTEQFVRPYALAAGVSEESDPQRIAAAWWLAHHWWQSLNPTEQPRSADTDEDLADLVLALAVPMDTLPALIGEHLGGTDPVRPEDLRTALNSLTWELAEGRLVVTATCPHPAIDVAIHDYFSALVPPPGIPALDLRIHPTLNADGQPSYLVPGAAFHMDEDRVRTLLMGEALYGEKDLAIRELYQNAVDATRHAKARIEWLSRTPAAGDQFTPILVDHMFTHATEDHLNQVTQNYSRQDDTDRQNPPYSGHVHFTQGAEDGKEYIDCTDNGVGMGLEEITTVFSQAGMRSADLPEFVTELDDYEKADPPIELWTNSRFGIGALSYFMLAERVEVTTTRLNRDGSLGQTLHFIIDDPGAMFTVTQAPQAANHGTTVRLWLREPGTSVATVLGSMVKVAPVDVSVDDPHLGSVRWEADQFNGSCVPDLAHRVWWVSDNGGSVLADGLDPTKRIRLNGAYIDCRGPHAPMLSVDRKEILHYDDDYVTSTLIASVGTLIATADQDHLEPISSCVLRALGAHIPWQVQDALSGGLANRNIVMGEVMGCTTNLARSGYIGYYLYSSEPWNNWVMSAICLGNPGRYPQIDPASWSGIVRPRPSDEDLLDLVDHNTDGALPLKTLAVACATMDRQVSEVLSRYRELGFRFPDYHPDLRWDDAVRTIFSNLNVRATDAEPVPEMALAQLGLTVKLPIQEVTGILDEWGVRHEETLLFADHNPTLVEEAFFSSSPDLTKRGPSLRWRRRGDELDPRDVNTIALYLGKGMREVAQMARDLGFQAPMPRVDAWPSALENFGYGNPTRFNLLLRAHWDNYSPDEVVESARDLGWDVDPNPHLDHAPSFAGFFFKGPCPGPLHRSAVLIAHQTSSTPVEDLIAGFEWSGFDLIGPDLDQMDAIDISLTIIENREDSVCTVQNVATPLNPYWVMAQSARVQLTASETLRRYLRLGYSVDHPELVIEPTPQLLMLASRYNSISPWNYFHDPGQTVLAAEVMSATHKARLTLDEILPMYAALGLDAQDPRIVLPVLRPGPCPGGDHE